MTRRLSDQEPFEKPHHRTGFNRYGETVEQVRNRKLIVMLNEAELAAIDDYQFSNRIETRAKAVRDLLVAALTGKVEK